MSEQSSATELATRIVDRSASGIASAIHGLIRSGELAPGTRLPTMRSLAEALGTSPTTINESWRSLSEAGVIDTAGRKGSFVAEAPGAVRPARFWRITEAAGRLRHDLSAGVPDSELLPPLPEPEHRDTGRMMGYLDPPVVAELEELLREEWQQLFRPEAITVVDGSLDALDRLLRLLVARGDRVVVEDPTFPPLLDLLETLGAVVVGVGTDEHGIVVDELRTALREQPAVLLMQPRAQNPTGVSTTPERMGELASVLHQAPRTVILEDDHVGSISTAEPVTLARELPARTVHVRSFSKSHGPDLRLAALGGPADIVERLTSRRSLGPAWTSRLLQQLLVGMLTDEACRETVRHARDVYARRRALVVDSLRAHGVACTGWDGFNVWVSVSGEYEALAGLAANGIGAAPGRPFQLRPNRPGGHLRLTTATVDEELARRIAGTIAETERALRAPGQARAR